MRCRTDENVPKVSGGKTMRNIYREYPYKDFYCEIAGECTDVEVLVQEIPDTVGPPVFHSVKCTWASANGCAKNRKCCAYQYVLEEEY